MSDSITLAPCVPEDSANCYWDAQTQGNGQGVTFFDYDGTMYPVYVPVGEHITSLTVHPGSFNAENYVTPVTWEVTFSDTTSQTHGGTARVEAYPGEIANTGGGFSPDVFILGAVLLVAGIALMSVTLRKRLIAHREAVAVIRREVEARR